MINVEFFTLDDFAEEGKRVLVRVDYNLPFDENGNIMNDQRIKLTLPTFKYLISLNSKIIVMTHFKRPKGKIVEELRVDKIAERFEELVEKPVKKMNFSTGAEVESAIKEQEDEIIFLENIQFESGEMENSEKFGRTLASYADAFILDAFGQAHREYASLCLVQKFIPSFAGRLLENEIENLDIIAKNPKRPIVAIIGGAKNDKIDVIENLLQKKFEIIVGGVLANTFLKANGIDIKGSKYDKEGIKKASALMSEYREQISIPVDVVAAAEFSEKSESEVCGLDSIHEGWLIMDIGPVTRQMYKDKLSSAMTIFWSGPIGVFEWPKFAEGSKAIAEYLGDLSCARVIGGGESATAVIQFGVAEKMTHVSSGGGAALKYMTGKPLPAVIALEESYERYS